MARRIIPNTLKTAASLQFYGKGGEDLHDSKEIIELCRKITTFLKREANANCENTNNRGSRGNRNDRPTANNGNGSSNSAPYRKHEGAHLWKDCPENWRNKIAAMTMLESPTKPPIQILKDLTQGKELEEKSRVQKISNPLMDPQWSISTATAKPTTNLHAAAMPHAAN